jgi:PAS domain-containing protein
MDATGLDVNGVFQQHLPLGPQLQVTLNIIPAHAWYALPNGQLTFLNERAADYLGLPADHPLRLGTGSGVDWESHILFLHPDDRDETRRARSDRLNTGGAGEVSFRVRNAEGAYRWFISCAEPVRAANGALLYWIGLISTLKNANKPSSTSRKDSGLPI